VVEPVEKYAERQIGSFGPGSGENKTYLKQPILLVGKKVPTKSSVKDLSFMATVDEQSPGPAGSLSHDSGLPGFSVRGRNSVRANPPWENPPWTGM